MIPMTSFGAKGNKIFPAFICFEDRIYVTLEIVFSLVTSVIESSNRVMSRYKFFFAIVICGTQLKSEEFGIQCAELLITLLIIAL